MHYWELMEAIFVWSLARCPLGGTALNARMRIVLKVLRVVNNTLNTNIMGFGAQIVVHGNIREMLKDTWTHGHGHMDVQTFY